MAKTKVQEIQDRIRKMQDSKQAELDAIQDKQSEARTKLEAAQMAIKDATESTNLEAYEKAQAEKKKALAALDMYTARYKQINNQEYISEEESDSVITSLLDYEKDLEETFISKLSGQLKEIANTLQEYSEAVKEAEGTLDTWQKSIHANYRSETTVFKETGTNRSPRPIAVHSIPFRGCKEALQLEDYLKKAEELIR